jgi:hypothetical protein
MWMIETTNDFERRLKRYKKKRPLVLAAVLGNLDTYFETLKRGIPVQRINFGFLHREPHGVKAIDQKGGEGRLAQARLYVYPDEKSEVLYLITLGDKDSQQEDIQNCNRFMLDLQEEMIKREPGEPCSDV